MSSDNPPARQPKQDPHHPASASGGPQPAKDERDEDWVADVKRWYFDRARGVDVAKRQEVLKDLQ